MDVKKELLNTINSILKEKKFVKKNSSWYFKGDDLIVVINLQKSQWSNGFYLNIYIYDTENLDNNFPINFYDYSDRLENIFKSDTNLKKIYEFDNLSDSQVYDQIFSIKSIIEKYYNFFITLGNYKTFKNFIVENNKQNYISLKIKKKLDLN